MQSKKKLNILIFSWRGPGHPSAGGAEISTHEHAKRWVQAGFNVTLFTSFFNGAKKEDNVDGVKIIRRGSQFLDVQVRAFKWYLLEKHEKFDLIVDEFHGIPFFTPLFASQKKMAFIHEVAKEVWSLNQFAPPLNYIISFLGKPLEPLLFRMYQKVDFMTVSESTKNDLIAWGIPVNKITVVHNGINSPKIKTPAKESKKTIIFLGALARDKGIEQTLEVFHYLQQIYKDNVQFWVVGRGDLGYQDFLNKKTKKLGLKNIKFWGYVSETEKFKLLAKAHVLINTSVREGWGLVVIEAASVGTPTLAFNVAGLRDSIVDGKTGILVNELSSQMLAEKLTELLENKIRLSQISKNAISWSKNFSWEKSAASSLKLIKDISG